ncbi:PASTA domain-containing protein [Streptomyces tanashiensis]|uniref:PASTA domain-containing protein n=1 Tax=Streptomyces tanashiensis TaxID=67367 RepID=UPI0036E126C1
MDPYTHVPPPPPLPPRPAPRRRWRRRPLVVAGSVLLPSVGIALLLHAGDPSAKGPVRDDARPPEATATGSPAAEPSKPAVKPAKPSGPPALVGKNLKEARGIASAAGFDVVSHDASDQDAEQWDTDNWKVCFQTSAGQRNGDRPALDLGVVRVEAPCPATDGEKPPWPTMPAVTGLTFARAVEALKPVGFRKVEPESAYSDVTLPGVADPWKVCFQDPRPGRAVENPQFGTVYLKLAPPDAPCPERPYAQLRP